MKMTSKLLGLAAAALLVLLPGHVYGQSAGKSQAAQSAVYGEIQKALGRVPGFMRGLPLAATEALWKDFQGLWLTETAIPGKYKDLMSLAVASQVPCEYCIYADTQFAKLSGASDQEIQEAVLMASLTRKASTVLNGAAPDAKAFASEANQIFAHMGKSKSPVRSGSIDGSQAALRDAKRTLGQVPAFVRHYPPNALDGYWMQFKNLQLSSETAIPGKYKELIGLAVASQIPCTYCVSFHKQAARNMGASQAEIDEAVAIGGDIRQWSTILYGMQIDKAAFRRDIDAMVTHLRRSGMTTRKAAPQPKRSKRSKAR